MDRASGCQLGKMLVSANTQLTRINRLLTGRQFRERSSGLGFRTPVNSLYYIKYREAVNCLIVNSFPYGNLYKDPSDLLTARFFALQERFRELTGVLLTRINRLLTGVVNWGGEGIRFEGAQLRVEMDFEVEEVYLAVQKGSRVSMLVRGHFVKPEGGRHGHLPTKLYVLTATVPKEAWERESDPLTCIERYGDNFELREVER